ncbi:MAG TPA: arsenate reductase ArsC [Candidatus Thermoplasmatota archaeon]|nr:arsenate reductase ArsC [Candidatus Thermoplasmatota archaeon]
MTSPKLRVLFACVGNSGRSIMAEAFARHHGGALVDARSGGSAPLGHVLPGAIQVMREKGIDVSSYPSKGFDAEWITKECDLVVTMGCGDDACPAFIGKKMRDWELEDPKGKDIATFRRIRDDIEARVLALLAEHGIAPRARVSPRPLGWGLAFSALAVALAAAGVGLSGPLNPSEPRPALSRALEWSALPVAIVGGTLVAVWLGRRAAADEERE